METPLEKGSHAQYTHPTKTGRVTVAGKPGDDVHPKTLASVVRHSDATLSNVRRARVTFSRMSEALAVQMKGFGA